MELWHYLSGIVTVRITTADPPAAIRGLEQGGFAVFQVRYLDELTFSCQLPRAAVSALPRLLQNWGGEWEIVQRPGLYWKIRSLLSRPVLLAGLALTLAFWLFLPSRIFFFRVEGNVTVPTALILEKAAEGGVRFGASRKDIRSEKLKNELLAAIPDLQWAGINTSGCVATISVRERQSAQMPEQNRTVTSIIAARDGIIRSCTVTRGSAACTVGQAVKAGQVLISGYTDCGLTVRGEQAKGEVSALTQRSVTLLTPSVWVQRGEKTEETKKFSLIIGKKRINFYKGSGILDTTCDKMYAQTYLLLPGGFQLPVALVTEQWTWRETADAEYPEAEARQLLSRQAADGLKRQMVAGTIRQKYETLHREDGVFRLYGRYVCTEMICKTRTEEKLPNYAETG